MKNILICFTDIKDITRNIAVSEEYDPQYNNYNFSTYKYDKTTKKLIKDYLVKDHQNAVVLQHEGREAVIFRSMGQHMQNDNTLKDFISGFFVQSVFLNKEEGCFETAYGPDEGFGEDTVDEAMKMAFEDIFDKVRPLN